MSATRYFIDTEFMERPGLLEIISIGIVDQNGREFYEVSSEFDPAQANDWVKANVLPKLPPRERWIPKAEIARRLLAFVGQTNPEFWGYYADYDWVVLCWLYGPMVDLPKGWPMFCLDLRQVMHERGIPRHALPAHPGQAHDALEDARWLMSAYDSIFGPPESRP